LSNGIEQLGERKWRHPCGRPLIQRCG
jgi:hypothetical protein